jgi:hypothetical protein
MNRPLKVLGNYPNLAATPSTVLSGVACDLGAVLAFNRNASAPWYLLVINANDDSVLFAIPIPPSFSGIAFVVPNCVACPHGIKLAVSDSHTAISGDAGTDVDVTLFGLPAAFV